MITNATVEPPLRSTPSATRTFLPYLEGMRGFFGLYIAVMHAWYRAASLRPDLLPITPITEHLQAFGHNAIGMFIVISGYVIGLPVARNGQRFAGGIATFFARRARRILPAYYAALLIAIPIALVVLPAYHEALAPKAFLLSSALHFTLLQNVSNRLLETIDSPMWSIAIECDIYVVFPFVLVPLARRFGFPAMVAAAFGLGLLPTLAGALRHQYAYYPLSESCCWYIGLFALGYAAANFSIDARLAAVRRLERWPWSVFALTFGAIVVALVAVSDPSDRSHGSRWLTDIMLGAAVACQFTADAQARRTGRTTWFERFFRLRPLLFLGAFSYSFYLIQLPIIDLVVSLTRPSWSDAGVVAITVLGLVAALAVAYGFWLAIERPFMTAYRRRGDTVSLHSARVVEIVDAGGSPTAT